MNTEALRVEQLNKGELAYLGKDRAELGLALSGGGTRAASFSIGVLKALQESGALDEVDVISSVSGGSYASYWYFMQNYYLNRENLEPPSEKLTSKTFEDKVLCGSNCPKWCISATSNIKPGCQCKTYGDYIDEAKDGNVLFSDLSYCPKAENHSLNNTSYPDEYRFQYVLGASSNIMSLDKKPGVKRTIYNTLQYPVDLFTQALSVPFHWVANGLVFNWNVNIKPYRYYYQNGLERTYGYVPLSYNLEQFANDDSFFEWFPRVNAKSVSFNAMQEYLSSYKTANNKKLPYFIINTTADYTSSIQQSEIKSLQQSVYEFTPWGCGSGLTTYTTIEHCPDISIGRAVSISGAAVDGQNEAIDIAGKSDGKVTTFAGILNMFNADLGYNIRNHNPDKQAWYYWPAKLIPFPLYFVADYAIGDKINDIHLSDGGHAENLGIYPLVRRGVKKIIAVDAESDPKSQFSSLNRLKINLEEMGYKFNMNWPKAMNVYYSKPADSIIKGTITGGNGENIELVYIKLAMHRDMLKTSDDACQDVYPFTVVSYARIHDNFPQESTTDIFYSPEQFKAYRDLGYTITKTCGDRCKRNVN